MARNSLNKAGANKKLGTDENTRLLDDLELQLAYLTKMEYVIYFVCSQQEGSICPAFFFVVVLEHCH